MTPPASSQCRRALQRQIIPSRDAVWITNGLLASAFERYCQVSRAWERKASNVPGPLEGQRRLGRRRMGAASTWHCPPTPPSWAFLGAPNLSQWTWKPPSLVPGAERSRSKHDDTSLAALSSLLPRWVRQLAPQELDGQPVASLSAVSPEPCSPSNPPTRADPYAAVMDDFRWAAGHADKATLATSTTEMCSKFRQCIILGEITPDDILLLSNEVWETLESRFQAKSQGRRLSWAFCQAIMNGLATSKVFSPTLLDATFWNAFLAQISKVHARDSLGNLVIELMDIMPAHHRPHVSEGLCSVLGSFFMAWSRSSSAIEGRDLQHLLDIAMSGECSDTQEKLSALPSCLRQARMIAKALDGGTPEEMMDLLSAAHQFVVREAAWLAEGWGSLRYSWLYVLARIPYVNQDFLFDAAASLSDPSLNMHPLSADEISSLLLTQWTSRGYLHSPEELYHSYRLHRGERNEATLASLFLAVFSHNPDEKVSGLYCSAWKFLSKVKQTDNVIWSLAFHAQFGELPVQMLERLAFTSNDHRMAIRLRELWSNHLKTDDQREWYPGVFAKYAETIIHDPEIPNKVIWSVLDIGKLEGKGNRLSRIHRRRGRLGRSRADVVEKMRSAFMTAPHLSNRAALRHVSRSYAFLRLAGRNVPDAIVQDLYSLVTQDMWDEKPGRTRRLLWFLKVVERKYGLEMSWSCRLALRQWRSRMTKVWLSKGGGRRD